MSLKYFKSQGGTPTSANLLQWGAQSGDSCPEGTIKSLCSVILHMCSELSVDC